VRFGYLRGWVYEGCCDGVVAIHRNVAAAFGRRVRKWQTSGPAAIREQYTVAMNWVVDGRFEITELLGRGGMGEVWRARAPRQMREIAVKMLTARGAADETWRAAFRNEIRLAASLSHAHIVRILDHGIIRGAPGRPDLEGAPFLAMEIAAGGTLSAHQGQLYWEDQRTILLALLSALAHAHARGVVHRDLKPANVLLDLEAGELKLTDFGLAHALDSVPSEDRIFVGTPLYMAPEQFGRNWRDLGPWTDLYALGCMAYALATGGPPFPEARSVAAAQSAHRYSEPPALPVGAPVPEGFEDWLAGLLEKDPGHRFQRAADAASALRELGDPPPDSAPLRGTLSADTRTLTSNFYDHGEDTDEVARERSLTISLSAGLLASSRPIARMPRDWRHSEWSPLPDRLGLSLFGLRETPMVGRHRERDRLWAALGEVRSSGRPMAVSITGATGVGKSRLARWLCERAHELGLAHVLVARHARDGGAGQGLGAMLARFLRCTRMEPEPLAERLRNIVGGLDPGTDSWRALLEFIHPGSQGGVCFTDTAQRDRSLSRFFRSLSRTRPVVLWLDDIDLDSDTLRFAQHLSQQPGIPVLLVCTSGAAVLPGRAEPMPLSALSGPQIRSMIGSLLLLDPVLMDEVARVTEGNPLLALQLVGSWVAEEHLQSATTGWRLGMGRDARRDLGTLWEDRLAPVLGPTGEVLELAATVGMELDSRTWHGAGGTDALLDPLLRRGLAVQTDPTDPGAWRFAHADLRRALLRRAERAGRLAKHHLRAAALAETVDFERCGRHLWAAGELAGALLWLSRAAVQAHERGEYARAHRLLDAAGELLDQLGAEPDDPRRIAGWVVRARVLRREGASTEATTLLERIGRSVQRSHGEVWLDARLLQAEVDRKSGDLEQARAALREALAHPSASAHPALRARLLLVLAESLTDQGSLQDAELLLRQAQPLASVHDVRTEARIWQQLAEIGKERGDFGASWSLYQRAELASAQVGDRWCHASVLNSMGDVARYQGMLDEALALYARAGAVFSEIGSDSQRYTEYNTALVHLERGEWGAVREVLDRAMPAFLEMGHRATWADTLIARAACRAQQGDESGVAGDLSQALGVYIETGVSDADSAELAETTARILTEAGLDPQPALEIARHVWAALERENRLNALAMSPPDA